MVKGIPAPSTEMCGHGLQHSRSLPFPSVHSQSHSHDASDLIPIPVPLPEFIPIPSHSHSRLTTERHLSLNNQTMITVRNANTQLSYPQNLNSEMNLILSVIGE